MRNVTSFGRSKDGAPSLTVADVFKDEVTKKERAMFDRDSRAIMDIETIIEKMNTLEDATIVEHLKEAKSELNDKIKAYHNREKRYFSIPLGADEAYHEKVLELRLSVINSKSIDLVGEVEGDAFVSMFKRRAASIFGEDSFEDFWGDIVITQQKLDGTKDVKPAAIFTNYKDTCWKCSESWGEILLAYKNLLVAICESLDLYYNYDRNTLVRGTQSAFKDA